MKATLFMLAVTAMKTGICLAGARREAPQTWVRPVREFGAVLLGDITYPAPPGASGSRGERRLIRPFDVVEVTLGRARPEPPHVEDWTCDFSHAPPRLLATLPESERVRVLDAAAASSSKDIWTGGRRSLGTLRVDSLSATFASDRYTGTFEARLVFLGLPAGVASVACTDLKWRAFGRKLLAQGQTGARQDERSTLRLDAGGLHAALGAPAGLWLALGLSRAHDGRNWPLVVGVHTVPDYEADVDYTAL